MCLAVWKVKYHVTQYHYFHHCTEHKTFQLPELFKLFRLQLYQAVEKWWKANGDMEGAWSKLKATVGHDSGSAGVQWWLATTYHTNDGLVVLSDENSN